MTVTVRRRFLAGLSFLLTGTLGAGSPSAHDFWLQPSTFWAMPGAPVPITIWVGHGADRQRWGVDSSRVVLFQSVGPDGIADRKQDLPEGPLTADIDLSFAAAGTHIVMLESNHAESELPALRFNDYLDKEGLTPAIKQRETAGTQDDPGREIYSRRAKLLIRVGSDGHAADFDVTAPLGMTLEIVPERNPYELKPGESLPLRVIYEGVPLSGASVKLTNLDFDSQPIENKLTDDAGRAVFIVPQTGLWQLNVVWTKPISGNPKGDFDTTFASLTFGFSVEPKP